MFSEQEGAGLEEVAQALLSLAMHQTGGDLISLILYCD